MDRRVTPPKWVAFRTWGPPPPCKQALKLTIANLSMILSYMNRKEKSFIIQKLVKYLTVWDSCVIKSALTCEFWWITSC